MRKIPTALALGELRWEYVQDAQTLGGNATIFACRFAALGHTTRLAVPIGCDEPGDRAREILQSYGVDVSLLQSDPMGATNRVECAVAAEGRVFYQTLGSGKHLELEVTPELISDSQSADILYMSSATQGEVTAGATLRSVLESAGPSFKIYDIDCGQRVPTREELEAGLSVASVVHTRGEELPTLCEVLGLPELEPGLFAPAITERFGSSYCVVADPFAGVLISSIVGELVGLDRVRADTVDIRGWHEAFLAAVAHHVFRGSSLSTCCAAGMRYGDLIAMNSGALAMVGPESLALVTAADE
jgi:sugar/nucleoside kinase (ribokinase family)